MNTLESLGFSRYRTVTDDVARAFTKSTGVALPDSYTAFLEYREPAKMPLSYRFQHVSGEEWEGQVSEFFEIAPHADDVECLSERVIRHGGVAYLPVACDAGGNYIYLALVPPNFPVVDVEASTGAISEIAPSFDRFMQMLYPVEDY